MLLETPRLILRDFRDADLPAFQAYQADPRYRALRDLPEDGGAESRRLLAMFQAWQRTTPRRNWQVAILDRATGTLCGCVGLRTEGQPPGDATLGIELAPDQWGRHGLAVEALAALLDFGFGVLRLERVLGETASGNHRVERLARWFGGTLAAQAGGPDWMARRGWTAVTWAITREGWEGSPGRRAQGRRGRG